MSDQDLQDHIEAVRGLLLPFKGSAFFGSLYKVSVYIDSVSKNWQANQAFLQRVQEESDQQKRYAAIEARVKAFQASLQSSLRFSRLNLDSAMKEALETIAKKPRSAALPQERKKAEALKRSFDRFEHPEAAMLDHFRSVSDPLDKYLLAGPWAFEYLKARGADLAAYYADLMPVLGSGETVEGQMVSSYAGINRAVDDLETAAMKESAACLEH